MSDDKIKDSVVTDNSKTSKNPFASKFDGSNKHVKEKSNKVVDFNELRDKFSAIYGAKVNLEFMDWGSIGFNHILGGGIPKGRMIAISSPTGLGKTTCCLHACKKVCSDGGLCIYLDVEHALNSTTIEGVGLTEYLNNTFLPYGPQTFKECEEIIESFSGSTKIPSVIILDSITALSSEKIISGTQKVEDVEPGWHARMSSTFLSKFKHLIAKTGTSMILINQERVKISFMGPSRVEAAGGSAVHYYPDINIDMQPLRGGDIIVDGAKVGIDLAIEAYKNKVTKPYVKSIVSVIFGKGISNARACTYLLEATGAVHGKGAWYDVAIDDIKAKCQGRVQLEEWIKQNENVVIEFLKSKGML
jgi:recombination protein RecA